VIAFCKYFAACVILLHYCLDICCFMCTVLTVLYCPVLSCTNVGTTRRIDNWDTLTKQEQEVSWRRISKRNEARRKVLLEKQQQEQAQQQEPEPKDDL
jgi:hypothetical protein